MAASDYAGTEEVSEDIASKMCCSQFGYSLRPFSSVSCLVFEVIVIRVLNVCSVLEMLLPYLWF